jgi:hypothetical protein
MKEDDSRRISLLAEGLLSKFEQEHTPIKVASVKPSEDTELELASESPTAPSKMTAEIRPAAGQSLPEVEKVSKSVGRSLTSPKLLFNPSFWFKWIGISVFGLIFLSIIFDYDRTIISSGSYPFPGSYVVLILFSLVAGSLSFVQWFLFRDRLQDWWITANAATAIVLGLIHRSLYYADIGWEHVHLRIPFVVWLIGNFVLGPVLMQRTQKKSSDFSTPVSAKPPAELMETRTGQNIFFISLSLSLVLFVLYIFSTASGLTSFADIFWVLLSIADILVGISFILIKEIPRNFGFITLVISWFLNGIIAFASNFPPSLLTFPALLSLSSGLFFITQEETKKDFKFIALSGFLISLSVAQIAQNISAIYNSFLIISALFALVAAIFFFRGK